MIFNYLFGPNIPQILKNKNEQKKNLLKNFSRLFIMEATTGFEPVIRVLQTRALPLGYVAITTLV